MENNPILIHSHIPKCAGTTINSQLVSFFGQEHCLTINYTHDFSRSFNSLLKLSTDELRKIRFIYGHLPVKWIESYLHSRTGLECYTFSILRDPLDRAVSQIFYWLEHGALTINPYDQHLVNRELLWRGLSDNVEDFYIKWMTNYFFGGDKTNLENILTNYQETIDFLNEVHQFFPDSKCLELVQDYIENKKNHQSFFDYYRLFSAKELTFLTEIHRLKAFLYVLKGDNHYHSNEVGKRRHDPSYSPIYIYSLSQFDVLQTTIKDMYGFVVDFQQRENLGGVRKSDDFCVTLEEMLYQKITVDQIKSAGGYPLTQLYKPFQVLMKKVVDEFGGGLLHRKVALDSALYQYVTEHSRNRRKGVVFWL